MAGAILLFMDMPPATWNKDEEWSVFRLLVFLYNSSLNLLNNFFIW